MGVPEKIDPGPSWRKMLGSPGMWTEFLPGMVRLAGARTAAVAVEMWKSRVLDFGAISKRGGKRGKVRGKFLSAAGCRSDFSTLATARHFHSDTLTAPPSPGRSGRRPRRRRFCLPGGRTAESFFSQEVKS